MQCTILFLCFKDHTNQLLEFVGCPLLPSSGITGGSSSLTVIFHTGGCTGGHSLTLPYQSCFPSKQHILVYPQLVSLAVLQSPISLASSPLPHAEACFLFLFFLPLKLSAVFVPS